jgi:hypothetical protein
MRVETQRCVERSQDRQSRMQRAGRRQRSGTGRTSAKYTCNRKGGCAAQVLADVCAGAVAAAFCRDGRGVAQTEHESFTASGGLVAVTSSDRVECGMMKLTSLQKRLHIHRVWGFWTTRTAAVRGPRRDVDVVIVDEGEACLHIKVQHARQRSIPRSTPNQTTLQPVRVRRFQGARIRAFWLGELFSIPSPLSPIPYLRLHNYKTPSFLLLSRRTSGA